MTPPTGTGSLRTGAGNGGATTGSPTGVNPSVGTPVPPGATKSAGGAGTGEGVSGGNASGSMIGIEWVACAAAVCGRTGAGTSGTSIGTIDSNIRGRRGWGRSAIAKIGETTTTTIATA